MPKEDWGFLNEKAFEAALQASVPERLPDKVAAAVITRPVSTVENGLVRHNPGHLAWELVRLHAQRNIRLVEDSLRRTPRNRVEK